MLSNRIRALREDRDLLQKDLAIYLQYPMGFVLIRNQIICYNTKYQPRRRQIFSAAGLFLVFSFQLCYTQHNVFLEGGCTRMGWNGCVFFKKGNP